MTVDHHLYGGVGIESTSLELKMPNALKKALEDVRSVCLTTTELDGDAVGAIVAFVEIINRVWPQKPVTVVTHEALPSRYRSIVPDPNVFLQAEKAEIRTVDLALVVDGDRHRLRSAEPHYLAGKTLGMCDHHRSSDPSEVDVAFHDPTAASTTEMVLQLADLLKVDLTASLARALYAGLVFDTSIFRYRMTQPRTLRAAARLMETGFDHATVVEDVLLQQPESKMRLKGRMLERMVCVKSGRFAYSFLTQDEAQEFDTGGLVDELVFIDGIQVGILFVERTNGVKVSIRSRGDVDVARLASQLAPRGGGHARAAGATLVGSLDDVLSPALDLLADFMEGAGEPVHVTKTAAR